MDFSYQKNDNTLLFESFESNELFNMKSPQNYIPIYQRFFTLNETNYNNINLNHHLKLIKILERYNENKYLVNVETVEQKILKKEVFFKLIPLIDPIKYMSSNYDLSDNNLMKLPTFLDNRIGIAKARDPNNQAYVDSFFTYLTSVMLHDYGFIHGVDFYGSYLGMKNNYLINIADDLDYLQDCKEFHKNRGVLYDFDRSFPYDLMNRDTRDYKERIHISSNSMEPVLEITDIEELQTTHYKDLFIPSNLNTKTSEATSENNANDISAALLYDSPLLMEKLKQKTSSLSSSNSSQCSSRSSNTSGCLSESNQSDESLEDTLSTASEDSAFVKLKKFPIQVVALEKCEKTLDSFIMSGHVSEEEYGSIVMQILMMLITYQKVFGLTHNDLHTNNIMYVKTDKQYLYYKYDGKFYKVPTFGKIYKIIDYGRAIYKFRGNLMCSDSYHEKGDAATQYNFEPYFDSNKKRVEPNFSFDLCRLGCALYDMLLDGPDDEDKHIPIIEIMTNWCLDDKGRNILYKNNGEERYPDFKLYKMIARSVHNHVPSDVIKNEYFEKYVISKKKINKQKVMNIDKLISHQ